MDKQQNEKKPSKMVIIRKPCGCIQAAVLNIKYLQLDDIIDPLNDGCVIQIEEHERIGFERCFRHKIGYWLVKMKYKLLAKLEA